jgi:hypothetical protein
MRDANFCCHGDCNQGRRCPLVPCRVPLAPLEPPIEQRPVRVPTADIVRVLFVALAALLSVAAIVDCAARAAAS